MKRRTLGLFAASTLAWSHVKSWAATEITVGQIAPLSGVLATTGAHMVLGGKVYFDYINATGGVNGQKIRHLVLDDGYKIDETVRLTRDLLARPEVTALYGFAGTANIGKLLEAGVLQEAAPRSLRPTPAEKTCATPSTLGSSTCGPATPTNPSTWSSRSPRSG